MLRLCGHREADHYIKAINQHEPNFEHELAQLNIYVSSGHHWLFLPATFHICGFGL